MNPHKLYEKTLKEFTEKVIKELNRSIDSIIVYGSVARGEATKDSDIDILIISQEKDNIREKVLDISYDIDLENNTATTRVYLTPDEIEHGIKVGSPFIDDILTQGVILYDNGTFKSLREKMLKISR